MRRLLPLVTLTVLLAGMFTLPSFAQAESCTCFCGSSTAGAASIGVMTEDLAEGTSPKAACADECDARGLLAVGCYETGEEDLAPEEDKRCWLQPDCEASMVTLYNGTEEPSRYGGQSAECPANMGFCYNPANPINLSVAIDDLTTATTIGEYINAVYIWLVGAAAIVAIVVLMVGGLQYMVSRGGAGITKAKERIVGAVRFDSATPRNDYWRPDGSFAGEAD